MLKTTFGWFLFALMHKKEGFENPSILLVSMYYNEYARPMYGLTCSGAPTANKAIAGNT